MASYLLNEFAQNFLKKRLLTSVTSCQMKSCSSSSTCLHIRESSFILKSKYFQAEIYFDPDGPGVKVKLFEEILADSIFRYMETIAYSDFFFVFMCIKHLYMRYSGHGIGEFLI